MELIGLSAIEIVIGIPVIVIFALVRSRVAERRIEESWYKFSDHQGEIAGLRREFTADRKSELPSSPFFDGLSKKYRVIAVDPLSQGESAKTTYGHLPEGRARDYREFLDKLVLKQPELLAGRWDAVNY